MAGIGFPLRELSDNGRVSGRVAALSYGVAVASGPWLLTIAGLGLIGLLGSATIPPAVVGDFRALVIYAFMVSFICAMPVTNIGTRQLADALFARKPEVVPTILLSSLSIASGLTVIVLLILHLLVFRMPAPMAIGGAVAGALTAQIWVAAGFASATRSYLATTAAFGAGMVLAVAGSLGGGVYLNSAPGMIWGYCGGLTLVLVMLVTGFLATFPFATPSFRGLLKAAAKGSRVYWMLGVAGLVGALAVWVDKFVVWSALPAERTAAGLIHNSLYDNAMFMAYLAILPGLSLFIVHIETVTARSTQAFQRAVLGHASLHAIDGHAAELKRDILIAFHRIVLVQFGFCLLLVVWLPGILEGFGLQQRQIFIVQLGTMGALFHFVFFACTTVLLYLDLRRSYLRLQGLFLVANLGFTALTVLAGGQMLGFGYLAATTVSGVAAYLAMSHALDRVAYHTFITAIFTPSTAP